MSRQLQLDHEKFNPILTYAETLVLLRSKWAQGTDTEFRKLIHEVRPDLNRDAAGELHARLIEDGLMRHDVKGLLRWVE